MSTRLPVDDNNFAIPLLRLAPGKAHKIDSAGAPVRNATSFAATTRAIHLEANGTFYIAFGDGSVVATTSDHYFSGSYPLDLAIGDSVHGVNAYTHCSILSGDGSVTVRISELF